MKRRNERWLDYAIRATAVLVLVIAAYLGYSYFTATRTATTSSYAGRAIENLRKVVTANPGNAAARIRLAEALANANRDNEAVEQYEAALKIQSDAVPAMQGLATIADRRQDYPTAESYWKKIINLLDTTPTAARDPRLDAAYFGLGVTYNHMARYEDAVVALREAARIKMTASDTHYQLSVAYAKLGYADKQREELGISLTLDPGYVEANYDMGVISMKASEIATAAELFRIAVNRAPEETRARPQAQLDEIAAKGDAAARLAKAKSLSGTDAAAALEEARIALALDPKSTDAVRLMAVLFEQTGNKVRALNSYQRLAELSPQNAEAAAAIKRLSADVK